jgi:hypothetical protein
MHFPPSPSRSVPKAAREIAHILPECGQEPFERHAFLPAREYRLVPAKLPRGHQQTPVAGRDFLRFAMPQQQQVDDHEANSYNRL